MHRLPTAESSSAALTGHISRTAPPRARGASPPHLRRGARKSSPPDSGGAARKRGGGYRLAEPCAARCTNSRPQSSILRQFAVMNMKRSHVNRRQERDTAIARVACLLNVRLSKCFPACPAPPGVRCWGAAETGCFHRKVGAQLRDSSGTCHGPSWFISRSYHVRCGRQHSAGPPGSNCGSRAGAQSQFRPSYAGLRAL